MVSMLSKHLVLFLRISAALGSLTCLCEKAWMFNFFLLVSSYRMADIIFRDYLT